MSVHLNPVGESLARLDAAWDAAAARSGGASASSSAGVELAAMSDGELLELNRRFAEARRLLDGSFAPVAAELAARSRPELGRDGLARKTGHRTPTRLIATATGGHSGDAARMIQVGEATRERILLSGEPAPPKRPHIATALAAGTLSVPAAAAIAGLLDRLAMRVAAAVLDEAERVIVRQAGLLSLDELQAVIRRAEAHLDPDGVEPVVDDLRGERSLKIARDRAGMTVLTARLDPESAGPVVSAIQGTVTHELRTSRGADRVSGPASAPADASGAGRPGGAGPVAGETRSLPQLNVDALAAICRHALGCDESELPLVSTTVVVRMELADLLAGSGIATIDGVEQPIDVGTARRMAADAEIIPCVLGSDSEILDWGRAKRHFTRAQRLALVERDGGCAFCHLPPQFTEAHHIRWWMRDRGPTDLRNGILLCTACHHRVHDEGWEIRIDSPPGSPVAAASGTVWFVPPAHLDPSRAPRLGGRKRFDPLAWGMAA